MSRSNTNSSVEKPFASKVIDLRPGNNGFLSIKTASGKVLADAVVMSYATLRLTITCEPIDPDDDLPF